jgi:N-glycosylase/DNA lyase
MQTFQYCIRDKEVLKEIPDASEELMPGVMWGHPWAIFTPAYWFSQLWMAGLHDGAPSPYKSHGTLNEELVFCMLGGYGITAEMATAAFHSCREASLIEDRATQSAAWEEVLAQQLSVNGRMVRYRYPRTKAQYLAGAMTYLRENAIEAADGRRLRDNLLNIRGVGPKTAGWVARNYLDSDDVAILDVHLVRAGLLCNLFQPSQRIGRDYFVMESRFIKFCQSLGARPAVLDCLIWDQMRTLGRFAIMTLSENERAVGKERQAIDAPRYQTK